MRHRVCEVRHVCMRGSASGVARARGDYSMGPHTERATSRTRVSFFAASYTVARST